MDMGSYALADNVLGFALSYDGAKHIFHLDFNVGQKQRQMWIPAPLLIEIGLLSKSWRNLSQHSLARFDEKSIDRGPVMTKLETQATTDEGAILYPEFANGKSVGLVFSPSTWREFVAAIRA